MRQGVFFYPESPKPIFLSNIDKNTTKTGWLKPCFCGEQFLIVPLNTFRKEIYENGSEYFIGPAIFRRQMPCCAVRHHQATDSFRFGEVRCATLKLDGRL